MALGTFLTENLLTLLSYDKERAPIIRGTVGIENFGGQYREVATRLYDFIDKYKKPPGDHLPDILEDKITSVNKREANAYADIVEAIHDANDGINAEYVMSQVETFVIRQSLRSVAVDLTKALQRDTEESLEEARKLMAAANTASLKVFDPGLRLSNWKRVLAGLRTLEEAFPTGIPELDKRNFGPTRKELLLYISDTKKGKTWFLIMLAKLAVLHRLKVLHVTLEMSEERASQRYLMSLFSIAKRDEKIKITRIKRRKLTEKGIKRGHDPRQQPIVDFEEDEVRPELSFDSPDIEAKLERLMRKWQHRILDNIIIKGFPTGSLTIGQFEAYLQNLEVTEHFTPDLIVFDYPDLMQLDASNIRASLDEAFKGLRGVAVKRNAAMAVVSQSHRAAAGAKQVKSANVAEAYSKIAHADIVITYSQTESEYAMGLARLAVTAGRNDEDRIVIVISQQYALGQFAIDSARTTGDYWRLIEKNVGIKGERDDDYGDSSD